MGRSEGQSLGVSESQDWSAQSALLIVADLFKTSLRLFASLHCDSRVSKIAPLLDLSDAVIWS
eukprot:6212422-Pleurochrysis_carterae.AAC.4